MVVSTSLFILTLKKLFFWKATRLMRLPLDDKYSSTEAVAHRCSVKKVFLEISENSQENIRARGSFLIKLQASACNFIKKETLAQVFSCEFSEISKNTFSYRTPPVAAPTSTLFLCISIIHSQMAEPEKFPPI